jgi:predicted ATP-grasp superfamily ATP-dependent carboligase
MGVLVTNAENLISLSVIRSLGKKKIEVTEASSERHAISFFSKYCKHKLQYSSVKNEGKFIEEILEAIKSRKYDVMFPIVMDELLLISKHRDKFLTYTRIPFIEHQTLEKAFDKLYVTNLALENNIPCPKTYFCKEAKELEEIKNELEYPAVIKPRSRSGAAGVVYVNSPGELIEKYIEIYKRFGNPLIQECIPLKGEIFGFEALFNEKSEPRAIFVHRRIRQYPITGGPSTLRESVVNYEVKKIGD